MSGLTPLENRRL